ncbi:MAG: beta-N-acetylhexosaminidase [Arenicella sp.]
MSINETTPLMPLGPVMLDVEGLTLNDGDRQRLLHPLTGAVILFARNFKDRNQVADLIKEIKSLRTPSLLVAVDQEGGRVQRFQAGFTRLPAAAEFGSLWDENKQTAPMKTFESAYTMASELLAIGVDFSFAPVFDVTTKESEVIGDRCFHSNPDAATELLGAYIDGMHSAGMVAIAKHFPGHGGVTGDSHHCLPLDTRSYSQIDACDLVPYKALVDELQGVMSAHVLFEQCDDQIPTFSSYWLRDILRDQLGFSGIVFSDDLTMAGADTTPGDDAIVNNAERALTAGCDMVLVCNQPDKADALLNGLQFDNSQSLSNRLNALRSAQSIDC